jgi:hypothetical protein
VCPNQTIMPVKAEDIKSSTLCKEITINVPIGNKRSKIHLVMTGNGGEDTWQTFNKWFDAFFVEDSCNRQGQLHHIHHGEFSMDIIIKYLSTLDVKSLPLDLVVKKLDQLEAELEILF